MTGRLIEARARTTRVDLLGNPSDIALEAAARAELASIDVVNHLPGITVTHTVNEDSGSISFTVEMPAKPENIVLPSNPIVVWQRPDKTHKPADNRRRHINNLSIFKGRHGGRYLGRQMHMHRRRI